ncbi:WD40 repeat domain-containing protein [Streptomyces sp. TRM 70351]|uniref:nSTAND1 domain-containing NTPase n=1 Tax=Streptomyces sp. TRM 70351 TaxID=3116552 RepID=UPI002E7ADC27|nr:WD40 repeat domain-containing protein [Streptomyces sp. TRM 70351]MEE1931334.1 WD40 repeat domain-containing protein [Streptomyces sp. TRM 70351]
MSGRLGPGRAEGELDPEAGAVPRFAAGLRALRESAGRPTYRAMARRARYGVTALSQAAAGKHLPTRAVALAYVQACGGDVAEWERRWHKASAELAAETARAGGARPPYRGLTRFEPDDAQLFFGRDQLVDRLVGLTREHRLTAVFGPSGSGKSSLLRAGLIPRLRTPRDGAGQGGGAAPPAAVRILTPGADPLRTHADRLTPVPGTDADTWLVVDQFEELYTLGAEPADRDAFIDRLVAAADTGSRLRVVLAVRADFLGRCAEHAGLTAALQDATLLAGPMSRAELREAIVRPAAAAGLVVERSLTDRVLDDVEGAPGGLPMMSHALLETWRHRNGRVLTEAAYTAAGGLHGAVVRTAEQVYGEFTASQAELARRILLRLVAPGNGTPDTRRPAEHAELGFGDPAGTRVVLERLVRARLVTSDDDTVDLAHESLITAWPRLRGWTDAERDRLRVHRSLSEAARTWRSLGRENAALYAGTRLDAARDAFPPGTARKGREDGRADALTPWERQFLDASLRRRHRAARLRRTTVALLVALVLLATGTAVVALQARTAAQAQRDDAVFGRLTAEADGSGEGSVRAVAFAPGGKLLATAGFDGSVRMWRFSREEGIAPLGEPLRAHTASVWTLAFTPDGRTLATAGFDETVRLWDVSPAGRLQSLTEPLAGHTAPVLSLAFSFDGRTLATAGEDDSPLLWNVADPAYPQQLAEPLAGHTEAVWEVAFAPDGRTLASTGADRSVRLWHRPPAVLTDFTNPLTAVAYSPDGRLLAAASTDDALIRLWDVGVPGRPRRIPRTLTGHEDEVLAIAFTPDSRTLASGSGDGTVRLWDLTAPDHPAPLGEPLEAHHGGALAVAFTGDGRTLASGGRDHAVRLWDASRPGRVRPLGGPLRGHRDAVTSVAFARGGRVLASGSEDGTARMWHAGEGARARTAGAALTGHDQSVNAVAFAPDGRTLATGSGDRTVRLWHVRRADRVRPAGPELSGHRGPVNAVAFAPDGRTLATGSGDRTVRLWDVADPARAESAGGELTGHLRTVTSVAFSPDGDTLASAGYDLTARVWTLDADRAADTVCERTGGVLTRAEWEVHLPRLGYREACETRRREAGG